MIFGPVPTGQAAGAVLAHGLAGSGWAFKKGRVLSADDVAMLLRDGYRSVVVARLQAGDVSEDAAADIVARSIAGEGISVARAATGRANLFAEAAGLAVVDAARVHRLNEVTEAVTLATLPEFAVVGPRQMVATVKIIPFAVADAALDACREVAAAGEPMIRIAPFAARRAGLVQTRLPGLKASLIEKTAAVTGSRLAALGSVLADSAVVAHEESALAIAIRGYLDAGLDPILVLGASATVDRRDVVPSAIASLGGEVVHLGMPVDPGNLLVLAEVRGIAVLGLPGCARSPKLNGFDWVLQRLLAGLDVRSADIMRLGVGGLLTEIPSRPAPRERVCADTPPKSPLADSRIGVVVLAAGRGTRMPGQHKLLIEVGGKRMAAAAVDAAITSGGGPVVVVVGHRSDEVRAALAGRSVSVVHNPDYQQGLSTSIRAGLAALPADADGALFMLADMPEVRAAHLDRLIAAFRADRQRPICVPTFAGRRGNPVLWPARLFADLRSIEGDTGGRALLRQHAHAIREVAMSDAAVLFDVDEPADLAANGERIAAGLTG